MIETVHADSLDGPREIIAQHGAKSLSDRQLIMAILGSGTKQQPIDQVARELLLSVENIGALADCTLAELCQVTGIGFSKAVMLQAAIELGRRCLQMKTFRRGQIVSSQGAGELMLQRFLGVEQEQLIVIFLDTKNQIIAEEMIFQGTLNSSVAHPREIFHRAVLLSCMSFIICHNHPSGNPKPSQHDIEFTQRLVKCGELMGINCLDHLVIGHDKFVSFRELQLI
ncbi:RadC family protein [Agrilactobacillus fermenti]|uniref:RadC family protein n=1 Tax=Agrilactobacillus fermenti TaxID=2586909 RepID=UPI001E3D0A7C|nr:DNA repair protein RadC [Agrilactobacillus fermenti]MCD2256481.1 DNA repair protein RadC [Agrilactobacillus fermenti]